MLERCDDVRATVDVIAGYGERSTQRMEFARLQCLRHALLRNVGSNRCDAEVQALLPCDGADHLQRRIEVRRGA